MDGLESEEELISVRGGGDMGGARSERRERKGV